MFSYLKIKSARLKQKSLEVEGFYVVNKRKANDDGVSK